MRFYLLVALLFYPLLCEAQFSKGITKFSRFTYDINNKGEIIHAINDGEKSVISKIDLDGNLIWSKRFEEFIEDTTLRKVKVFNNLKLLENGGVLVPNLFVQPNTKYALSYFESDGAIRFIKRFNVPNAYSPETHFIHPYPKVLDVLDGFIVLNYYKSSLDGYFYYSLIKLNNNGEVIMHKEFVDQIEKKPVLDLNKIDNSRFAVIRNLSDGNVLNFEPDGSSILVFDTDLNQEERYFMDAWIKKILYIDGLYFVLSEDHRIEELGNDVTYSSLVCLGENFNVLWAKYFQDMDGTLDFYEVDSGFLLSLFSLDSHIDKIYTISKEGEELNSIILPSMFPTYSTCASKTHFLHEGNFKPDGALQPDRVLTCASSRLDELACYLPDNCFSAKDFTAVVKEIVEPVFLPTSIMPVEVIDGKIETSDFFPEYSDYCNEDYAGYPVPVFGFPDTICVGEEVIVSNLQNENGEEASWDIPGSRIVSSLLFDPGIIAYDDFGEYVITQYLTYNDCITSYSQSVIVVEPINLDLPTEVGRCDDLPFEVNAYNKDVDTYQWSNGGTESSLVVGEEGLYSLLISDEHCTNSFDIELMNFDYGLISVYLPMDTSICVQRLIEVNPNIDPSANFTWSDGFSELSRNIDESGFYTLTTSLHGCSISSSIQVQVDDCSTQIYMPNVFSPNKDGINDDFYPLGEFFEVIYFQIFDRWGTLIHGDPNEAWNGIFRQDELPTGVYTYAIQIKNVLLNKIEFLKGDVVLIR